MKYESEGGVGVGSKLSPKKKLPSKSLALNNACISNEYKK